VGCGTGRHSKHLAGKGFIVTGIDLSTYSLQLARHYKNDSLQFYRHDMRQPFGTNRFDVVLNLLPVLVILKQDTKICRWWKICITL
jgi:2-polyprenyl-3-methyl-5-hydroxy-6-metoxy-1,4-benzoquinol methylase